VRQFHVGPGSDLIGRTVQISPADEIDSSESLARMIGEDPCTASWGCLQTIYFVFTFRRSGCIFMMIGIFMIGFSYLFFVFECQ